MKYIFTFVGLLATLFAYGQSDSTSILTDSLEKRVGSTQGSKKIKILLRLSTLYHSTNPTKSLKYGQEAVNLSQRVKARPEMARALSNIGYVYTLQGNYISALAYYLRALDILQKENPALVQTELAKTLDRLAQVYYQKGYYEQALKYQLKALKIQEKSADQAGIASSFDHIGSIYKAQKMFVEALEYYNMSLKINRTTQSNVAISQNLGNIGEVYFLQKKYKEALDFYKRAFELISHENHYKTNEANLLEHIGKVYQQQGEYNNALAYFKKSLGIRQMLQNKDGISANLSDIAEIYLATEKYTQAIQYAQQSLLLANELKSRIRVKNASHALAEAYAAQKDFEQAYRFQKLYNRANDSLYNESKLKQIAELQAYYDLNKKEEEKKDLLQEKKVLQRKANDNTVILNNKQLTIYALGFVILLALATLFVLYNRARFRKNLTDELEQKVNDRTAYLKKLADELTRANHELDTFLYKASHDLKGPLSSLEGLCHVGLLEQDERKGMYFNMQREVLNRMQLLLFRIVEIGDIRSHQPETTETIKLKKHLKSVVRSMRRVEGYKNTSFSVDVNEDLVIITDGEMLDIALDNIVKNAVQHANSYYGNDSPHIRLVYVDLGDYHQIKIIDNGSGMPLEISERIFEMFFRGTDNFKGFGLGLYKAKIAISKLGGEISLLKAEKGETIFSITIPQYKVTQESPIINGAIHPKKHHYIKLR
ncbi:tetratricopeptide repeat-containing sensor histidine kinase [Microscilla marina]|uniref:histidine kinase n=1 Tax=Microscilla marina ATCC 23134 TaxID=313606 RepID=A1ZCR9_MICM2|nr:tetratricopeptide repeat protein [Microscilla marina]EAY32071.1 tetratricopeptide repeat domain protein [Microscilla marina ATCC 23134]